MRQPPARVEQEEDVDHITGGDGGLTTSLPETSATNAAPDDILRVSEPAIMRTKGRPRSSLVQRGARSQQTFDRSTPREPSGFELVRELEPRAEPTTVSLPIRNPQRPMRAPQRRRDGTVDDNRGGRGGSQVVGIPKIMLTTFRCNQWS